jgi:hypothetical protein
MIVPQPTSLPVIMKIIIIMAVRIKINIMPRWG